MVVFMTMGVRLTKMRLLLLWTYQPLSFQFPDPWGHTHFVKGYKHEERMACWVPSTHIRRGLLWTLNSPINGAPVFTHSCVLLTYPFQVLNYYGGQSGMGYTLHGQRRLRSLLWQWSTGAYGASRRLSVGMTPRKWAQVSPGWVLLQLHFSCIRFR